MSRGRSCNRGRKFSTMGTPCSARADAPGRPRPARVAGLGTRHHGRGRWRDRTAICLGEADREACGARRPGGRPLLGGDHVLGESLGKVRGPPRGPETPDRALEPTAPEHTLTGWRVPGASRRGWRGRGRRSGAQIVKRPTHYPALRIPSCITDLVVKLRVFCADQRADGVWFSL